jgi:predicted Fe-Mo cluster-binding NifX family protein
VSNPHSKQEKAKGIRVAEWLVSQKVDVVLTREDVSGKGPAYVLREAGVELRMTDKQTAGEAILSAGMMSSDVAGKDRVLGKNQRSRSDT